MTCVVSMFVTGLCGIGDGVLQYVGKQFYISVSINVFSLDFQLAIISLFCKRHGNDVLFIFPK